MKDKSFISRALCLFLAVLFLFVLGLTIYAEGRAEHDLSRPNSHFTEIISSAEILESYLGQELIKEERDYLAKYGDVTLKYDTGITTAYVQTEYSDATRTLSLTAYPYKYISEDKTEVVFVPDTVTLGERTERFVLDGDKYVASFSEVQEDDSLYAEVRFSLDFLISAEELNSLLNKAYNDAPLWIKKLEDYNAAKEEYEKGIAPYEEYLEKLAIYSQDYEQYLSEKKIYDEALSEYENYLDELRLYNQAIEDYNTYDERLLEYGRLYAEYREYLLACEAYEKSLEPYNEYLATLEKIRGQLLAIETAKTPMTMDRTLYSAIMGSLVDSVLENKDVLTSSLAGVSPEVIDLAGDCTEKLRALLKSYYSLKTEEEKYSYYTVNYEAFRDNFSGLLRALDNLYRNKRVRGILIAEEKDVKYIILVSQLYIISNALSNTDIYSIDGSYAFDKSYTIENRTPLDVLENIEYLPDTNSAAPLSSGYPEKIAAPKEPTRVEEPIKPEVVVIPAYPEEITKPEPIRNAPTAPTVVPEPVCPEYYEHTPEVLALTEAYEANLLLAREETAETFSLLVSQRVNKKIFGVATVSVVFCNSSGDTLYLTEVDMGTRAEFMGEYPTKEQDEASLYSFSHWIDENGESVDLSSVSDNLVLYPAFSSTPRKYNVTFVVDDEEYTASFDYGSTPICPVEPKKQDDGLYRYVFSGWDAPIRPVSCDAIYNALFDSSYLMPLGNVGAYVTVEDGYAVADCTGVFASQYDASYLIEKARAEQLGITLVTSKGVFSASYSTVLSMYKNGHTVFSPSYVVSNKNGVSVYSYSVNLEGAENIGYRMSASLPIANKNDRMRLTYVKDGVKTYVPFSFGGESIELTVSTGVKYTLCEEYTITKIPSQLVSFELSDTFFAPGDAVTVDVNLPKGVSLIKVYLLGPDGEEIEIKHGSFTMPKGDCTVGVLAERTPYTVTFVNGFRTIATKTYYYGDTVIPPSDPIKLSDGIYSYTFVGWTPKLDTVTGNVTYTARFDKILLPDKTEPSGPQVSDGVMRIIIIAIIVGSLLFAGLVTLIVVIIVKVVKKRKKRSNVADTPDA